MKTDSVTLADLRGVFSVPPLARSNNRQRSIDFNQNALIIRHIASGGIRRFLYGGNALLYHLTEDEYAELLEWLADLDDEFWAIPSLGPSYGRAMDQALLLRNYRFPCAMMLPSSDPRDAAGLERGLREVTEIAKVPLIIYLKEETNFGADLEAGLDVVGRLLESGNCVAIKYAVVRPDPLHDSYLEGLLKRVDRNRVISGMGERPALVHLRDWQLPGLTTGSGCVAPHLCNAMYDACAQHDYAAAEALRSDFMPLEDLRDMWGPARVLHFALKLAGIANTGPLPPYLSELSADKAEKRLWRGKASAKNKTNGAGEPEAFRKEGGKAADREQW